MRRFRFTILAVAATVLGAAGVFVLWSTLGAPGVAPAARSLVVTVAAQPPTATPTVVPAAAPAAARASAQLDNATGPKTARRGSAKIVPRVSTPRETGVILVRFRTNDAQARALVVAKGGRIIQNSAGRLVASLPTPKGMTPGQYQSALAQRSDILYASADEVGSLQPVAYTSPTDSYLTGPMDDHWWLDAVKAQTAWQTGFGSSTPLRGSATAFKVAVIDTGIYMNHPDMANARVGKDEFQSYSWDTKTYTKDNDITPYTPPAAIDPLGEAIPWHGTATAGAVGAAVNNFGTVGSGYDVIPVGYKIQGPITSAGHIVNWDMSIAAAVSAIYDATNDGCKVINMSFGGSGAETTAMLDAESYAHQHGVLLIAAAGNSTTSTPFFPACDPNVVSVSAVATTNAADTSYTLADFSNFGPKVALSAPGQGMWLPTTVDSQYAYYYQVDGTSFSAPTVAGAAAFLWRAAPWMTADQITSVVESSAVDLGAPGRDDNYGYGLLDMSAAYNSLISQYPLLLAPTSATATSAAGSNSVTANWSPVAGTSVLYAVKFDGASLGTTSSTSLSLDNVAQGTHTIAIQPTSVYNWWDSSSATTVTASVTATEPITPTVSLAALVTKVVYPATAVPIVAFTDARSSQALVQWSVDGVNWYSTGATWANSASPAPVTISAPIDRTVYLRLAVTAAGWNDGFSSAIRIPYYASVKTPYAVPSIRHSKAFTVDETISSPARVSASSVMFKFYRQAKPGSRTWVLKKSVRATGSSRSGNTTTYRARLSLPTTGAYHIYAAFSGGGLYASATSAARAQRVK